MGYLKIESAIFGVPQNCWNTCIYSFYLLLDLQIYRAHVPKQHHRTHLVHAMYNEDAIIEGPSFASSVLACQAVSVIWGCTESLLCDRLAVTCAPAPPALHFSQIMSDACPRHGSRPTNRGSTVQEMENLGNKSSGRFWSWCCWKHLCSMIFFHDHVHLNKAWSFYDQTRVWRI